MKTKWIAINLLLLSITGLLGWQLHNSVLRFRQNNNFSQIRAKDPKQKMTQGTILPGLANPKILSPAEFAGISERNVFSETRSRDEIMAIPVVPEAPPLAQKPILVGVTISESQKMATIIDPVASPQAQMQAQGRRTQTKRIGDVYQGYTITDITGDHIVLESGTRKETIPLHEGSKRPQGGKTPILSTRVVSFGAGGASTGTPVAISGGGITAARGQGVAQVTTVPPAPAAGGSRGAAGQTTQATAPGAQTAQPIQQLLQQIQQGIQQGMQQIQQPPNRGNTPGNRGGNSIQSPFGPLTRPNQ
jgi:hypothetical protein